MGVLMHVDALPCNGGGRAVRMVLAVVLIAAANSLVSFNAHGEDAGRSGKQIVDSVCATCHRTGAQGAPKMGDRNAWKNRAAQGLTSLTRHALEGIRKMPPHGGTPGLSDLEIQRAITYMVNQSGGQWIEPVAGKDLVAERSGEQIVKAQCVKCHEAGVGGAPKVGDRAAWAPRMKQGVDMLVHSAIRGHGGMPSRGGLANLTDPEIRNAVMYMFNPSTPSASGTGGAVVKPAPSGGYEKSVGGIRIILGFVAAESLRAFPADSIERTMHGGIPNGSGYYHLNVSLFDSASDAPIANAKINARIEQIGLGGETKVLERMPMGSARGSASYGAYFKAMPRARYRVILRISTANSPMPVETEFSHSF